MEISRIARLSQAFLTTTATMEPELNEYMEEKQGMFGDYFALNGEKLEVGGEEDQSIIEGYQE